MCELRNHVTRVMSSVGGAVRPVPIVQNIRGNVTVTESMCILSLTYLGFVLRRVYMDSACKVNQMKM